MQYNKVEICGVNTASLPVFKEKEKMELLHKVMAGSKAARDELINGNWRYSYEHYTPNDFRIMFITEYERIEPISKFVRRLKI